MHPNRSMRYTYRTAVCDLCSCVIDFESGFFTFLGEIGDDDDDDTFAYVHPDCMAYFIVHGKRPTRGVIHTCGEPLCVRPDHLEARILEG